MLAEYIWLDGGGWLRSKTRVIDGENYSTENLPVWNFDGSSTKQASVENSEVILRPVRLYNNPFQRGYLVLCETFIQDDQGALRPHQSNTRYRAQEHFQYTDHYQPWYGIEQEYYIIQDQSNQPNSEGVHYCGSSTTRVGRQLAEDHLNACLRAGLKMSGINAEAGPSQWEYQIGPVQGIEAADQLWVSRFILLRVAERASARVSFHPTPMGEATAGSGCHVNFSTIQMRLPDGYSEITRVIEELKRGHSDYVKLCGFETSKRLTGENRTGMLNTFTWSIGSRNTSIRIPKETFIKQCGYFEDRRPSSNVDPYKVCGLLLAAAYTHG